jgi:hypothetical protein
MSEERWSNRKSGCSSTSSRRRLATQAKMDVLVTIHTRSVQARRLFLYRFFKECAQHEPLLLHDARNHTESAAFTA